MYTPSQFAMENEEEAQEIMCEHNFATLISKSNSDITASHLPLMWTSAGGKHGTLHGHMARANPQWNTFDGQAEVLAIFLGNHTYISPNWYDDQPAVPTWNYSTVHAYGAPCLIKGIEEKNLLRQMVKYHDPDPANAWPETNPHTNLVDEMVPHIVAFNIPILTLQSKSKLSQNRSKGDREQVIKVLRNSQKAGAQGIAGDMSRIYSIGSAPTKDEANNKT